jgi:cytochrome c oxidase assembly protein subunit 15
METSNKLRYQLIVWLLSGCFLVFGMVVVGGITRLTGSGLSITEWKVVTGTIPPLNELQWNAEFEKYKQIPQFKSVNAHFTLSDFKFIYFWEYIHRLFGRMIGLVFIIGLLYFYVRKAIPKGLMPKLILMFVLGGIQGFLGWYMVASGLSQNIRVSHIRLAIHLTFAFITFGYIFWVALTQLYNRKVSNATELTSFRKHAFTLLLLLTLQVIYGAFVAGTKAGWTYNTWPKMGVDWVPESIGFAWTNDGISSLINNLASIQFIHRGLAYILAFFIIIYSIKLFKTNLNPGQKNAVWFLLAGIFMQVLLGILTLLMQVPLWLGVMHQAVAFFLFAGVIYLLHRLKFE